MFSPIIHCDQMVVYTAFNTISVTPRRVLTLTCLTCARLGRCLILRDSGQCHGKPNAFIEARAFGLHVTSPRLYQRAMQETTTLDPPQLQQ